MQCPDAAAPSACLQSGDMEVIATLLGLMSAVVFLALLARKAGVPYPSVMVAAGAAASFIPRLPSIPFDAHYVMLLFLPPLLYSAAWQMPWRDLREYARPILVMAIGFVIFTTCAVGGMMRLLLAGLPWAAALAFGAVVSPTDPVAATAVTGRLGVPRRATTILEGESLFNDARG